MTLEEYKQATQKIINSKVVGQFLTPGERRNIEAFLELIEEEDWPAIFSEYYGS